MSGEIEKRLEIIEKRIGQLEQLIGVVLGRHKERSLKLEKRLEILFEKVEYRVEGLREYLQDSFLDEVREEVKGKTNEQDGHG